MKALTVLLCSKLKHNVFILFIAAVLCGCAQTSPQFEVLNETADDGISAQQIFDNTFTQHGGHRLDELKDVNVAIDGDWYYLITRIQPLVTDHKYRQRSEERIILSPSTYAVTYQGEAGSKQVFRSVNTTQVAYDDNPTFDEQTLSATALTSDAFYLFSLGPLALSGRNLDWERLDDGKQKNRSYYRINAEMTPGFGDSTSDFISLWVDKETNLTFRVHITLEGFETTKGAHVDTTYLNYTEIDGFTFPVHFFERVLGPIRIDAHEWWYTGIDINRALVTSDVSLGNWSPKAAVPAASFENARRP
ncbi:MAG: hypothetical protein AAGJ37_11990 [Pseudomonadota bacterium]